MYIIPVDYTDFGGIDRKEEFLFNLTEAELMDMNLSSDEGLENYLTKIIQAKDKAQLYALFKTIIRKSYGEKSPDGRRFMKSDELYKAFTETEAYSQIFMDLVTDSKKAAAFMNGIIPAKLKAKMKDVDHTTLPISFINVNPENA